MVIDREGCKAKLSDLQLAENLIHHLLLNELPFVVSVLHSEDSNLALELPLLWCLLQVCPDFLTDGYAKKHQEISETDQESAVFFIDILFIYSDYFNSFTPKPSRQLIIMSNNNLSLLDK